MRYERDWWDLQIYYEELVVLQFLSELVLIFDKTILTI